MLTILSTPFYTVYLIVKTFSLFIRIPSLLFLDVLLFLYRLVFFTPKLFTKEDSSLTYGEFTYIGLSQLIDKYAPDIRSFLDCGSGLGKALFFVSRYKGVPCYGIELNQSYNRFARFFGMSVLDGDFNELRWPESDVVTICGTCLSAKTLDLFSRRVEKEKCRVVFSVSRSLTLSGFRCVGKESVLFSWGKAIVYVYVALN